MALFKKSVLNKRLNNLAAEKVMLAYEKFTSNYKTEINNLQTQIPQTDQQIDQMVYKMYGLTDEEIGVVEDGYN